MLFFADVILWWACEAHWRNQLKEGAGCKYVPTDHVRLTRLVEQIEQLASFWGIEEF